MSRVSRCGAWAASLAAALALGACSHVDCRWRLPGQPTAGAGTIKRVRVAGVADASWAPGLAATLRTMAGDYVKLRRNYIVVAGGEEEDLSAATGLQRACAAPAEGVVVLEALGAERDGERLALTLRAELWACRGRRPVWQAQGHRRLRADDPRLAALTASYKTTLGDAAAAWAAAAFVLGQEVLDSLPDPALTEAEVEEKIEAG